MKGTKHIYMKYYSKKQWTQKLTVMVFLAMALGGTAVQAMPSGADIRSGQGSISQDGKNMTVQQNSQRMAIDWTKFDIAKDETVRYAQPDRNAISLNRVTGGQQSVIAGNLNANGNVILVNPNGVVFTKNSSVDVGGLVASTARLNDEAMKNFSNGKDSLGLSLDKNSTASVINEGQIKAQGGLVALHAANVENKGTITNEGGTLAMAAAKNLTLSAADDDKLNFTVDGELAKSQALNSGSLKADGGYVVMTAKSAGDVLSTVVNNTGTIEAKTLRKNEKGQILLDGGKSGQVEVSGTLDASGTEAGQSAGSIKVIGQKTVVNDGTNLLARGAIDGGKIETSGDVLNLGDTLNIDASGDKGSHGTWLLDPLEVVISESKPSSADHEYGAIVGDTNGKTKNNVIYNDPPSKQNANDAYNSTTWIDSKQVGNILSNGTDVMIQAISSSGAASITLESPIDITVSKSASKNPTFTLEANRNITINQNITAESSGKGLNIMLNADTDGDNIGAVIMNADVTTNGGWFKSATGGSVTHTYGTSDADKKNYGTYNGVTVGGGPSHDGSTVGTYFGGKDTAKQADNRFIKTNGGAITLNGEVAIGLNGGALTLDTGGGDLTVTGLINSGNSYKAYIYGTDDWNNKMIQDMVNGYLDTGTVPAYHYIGITYDKDKDGNLIKDGNGYKWSTKKGTYADGANNIHYVLNALTDTTTVSGKSGTELSAINPQWYTSTKAGEGYDSFIVDKASTITVDEYLAYVKKSAPGNWKTKYNALTLDAIKNDTIKMETLKADIAELIAHNWFLAEQIAENGTNGGAKVGDSYLATITTRLENSLSTPNGQHTLWVGGRGSGVRGRTVKDDPNNPATWGPSDPTLMDGFYWVTGPEGAASTYKDSEGNTLKYDAGTKFWDTVSSDWTTGKNGEKAYGLDPTWSIYQSGKKIITQPDNNGPFLTVGYGSDNQWDDANFGGETTWGFVQETNLANSSLKINTGKGTVALKGDIGKGQALDTLSIDGGTVKIGDTSNKVTDYNHGTVYVDHGLKITGTGNVTVGGEIHSGENPETDTSTTLEDTYKDNVTILSSGNIEVHGITSNTYDDGTTTTRGGKISLTSTGKTGKITLGAGVDYNGNATDGTLAAASTAAGAVVVDAQGSQGSLVNSTKGTAAITTGTDGTWQVYVNSPSDYDTSLGNNLNSNTNAQWTAKSGSNTTVKTNSSNNTLSDYTVTSSNKFIFQVTPVITISGGNQKKTYGDTLTDDQLRKLLSTSATYTDSTGKDVDVTQFGNFKEANYLTYVTSSDGTKTGTDAVAVSSGGAFATATRTDGNEKNLGTDDYKTASDGNRAFYVFNVEEDGAKALNGYDLKTVNGDIEILRKTLTINTDATQTYGNDAVTSGTPEADSTQLVNGDTLDTGSISYKIATDGKYADSKGRNDTAHVGSYENQYLTTGATVKASDGSDASANYAVTGSGTITVNPADLYLKVRDVSTTYGMAFDDTKYGYTVDSDKRGLVNGDTQDAVLGDQFLSYTNNGNATDPDKIAKGAVTQNVGNYELLGTANRTLADYNVHITSGTATVNKAKLALTVGDTSTTYGSGDWTPYTYTLTGNANGDTVDSVKENGITAVYTNTGAVTDAASNEKKIYTKDADGKYQLLGDFTLTGQTAKNYEIETNTPGKATVNKATVKVKLNDVSTTYGTAFDTDKYGYDPSKIEGLTNGDKTDVVTQVLNGDYKTGNIQYTNTGDASAEEKLDGKVTKTVNGGPYYLQGTTSQTLGNYNIEIENGNATINKATLHLSTGNYTETYGDAETVQKDLDRATTVTGEKNGDNLADLVSKIGIRNTSEALLSDTRTNDVKYKADGSLDNYGITTDFNKSLDNYDVVQDKTGSVTLTPVEITVDNEMIQTYGSKDRSFKEVVDPGLVNGDKISTDGLKMAPKAGGKYEINKGNRTTADAGIYKDDLTFSGGGIVHADGTTDASKNYKVTIKGDIIVNKAPLYVNTDDILTYYGVVKNTQSRVTGLTNGDQADGIQYGYGDYGHGYLNGNTTTNMPGNYAFGTSLSGPDFLKNYNIIGGNANLQIIQSKPDQTTHYVEGAHRPQDKLESALPVFRVDASGVVKQYGTYGIESQSQAVTLSPTGMRMPEPNQTSTQDRKYLTTLKTAHGHGTFRLEYNGVVLRVIPVDPAAEQIVEAGDKLKNVALSEQALHAAYTQMGLDLVNLKGVYIYMAPM